MAMGAATPAAWTRCDGGGRGKQARKSIFLNIAAARGTGAPSLEAAAAGAAGSAPPVRRELDAPTSRLVRLAAFGGS